MPSGDVLCHESLVATKACTVERVQQGFIRVLNENWPRYEGNCNGRRTLCFPDGDRTFEGFPSLDENDDVLLELDHPRWLNVDDRMGILFSGTGRSVYLNRHYYPPFSFRAVADDLFLSLCDQPRDVDSGDEVGELAALICPEQPRSETPGRLLITPETSENTACLITDGYLCAGNFGPKRTVCAFSTTIDGPVPVFPGTAIIHGINVEYLVLLQSQQAVYLEEVLQLRTEGRIKVDAVDAGAAYLTNQGDRLAGIRVTRDERTVQVSLRAGETVVI